MRRHEVPVCVWALLAVAAVSEVVQVYGACTNDCEDFQFQEQYVSNVWRCIGYEKAYAFKQNGFKSDAVNNLDVSANLCPAADLNCNRWKNCDGDCPRTTCEDPPARDGTVYRIGTCTLTGEWSAKNAGSYECKQPPG